jgi:methionyl-tRNA formyltransferase
MKITLYLLSQKGFEVLSSLVDNDLKSLISEVVVGRDKNVINDFAEETKKLCNNHNIKCFERSDNFIIDSSYSIAISWRWLITENGSKLIVLHDSILPKYRGFAPLVSMLINKESKIGVSAIFASEEYDRGEIIAQSISNINYPITITEAINQISKNYIELVLNIFHNLKNENKLVSKAQDETQASYSLWRNDNDYIIDWSKDAEDILTFINSVSEPYKGALTYINGHTPIRVLSAEVVDDVKVENRDFGKTIFIKEGYPIIVCGTGLLKIKKAIIDSSSESAIPFANFRVKLSNLND